MRIAMNIHALSGGGAERVFCQLASRWATAGHEVHVITWSSTKENSVALPPQVVPHPLNLLRPSQNILQAALANLKRVRSLRKTLRLVGPDRILSFCDQMNISTLQATQGLQCPVWIAERSDPAKQRLSPTWEHWRKRVYPKCSGCVVQTQAIADYLSQMIARERIVVIPNAVEPVGDSLPTNQAKTLTARVVLAVGRLSREKGLDTLLEAWRHVQNRLSAPGWQLHIAGTGAQQAELQRQGVANVHFLGWLEHPQEAYNNSSIYVLPSRYEGFPNSLLEAMSHGLPCIATLCSQAVEELSRGGRAVVVVPPESPLELADALVALANSGERRQALGTTARQVSLEYAWERIGPLWDRILSPPT